MNEHLLYEALAKYGIPQPTHGVKPSGFTRYGEHRGSTKYWIVPIGESFASGDWSTGLKTCVFPKTEKSLTTKQLAKRRKDMAEVREELECVGARASESR